MKKIRIATYCTWTSIGSILQAYALKTTFESIGAKSIIWKEQNESLFASTRVVSFKSFLRRVFEFFIRKYRHNAYEKRTKFINDNLNIEYYSTYDDLCKMARADDYDFALSGSDQVWNPINCNPFFFLDFVNGKRRYSYAASLGNLNVSSEKQELFKRYIANFDEVSVREKDSIPIIQAFTKKTVSYHIDPTFLVNADLWRAHATKYNLTGPYILLYMLYWDDICKEQIIELKKMTGLPVYAIADTLTSVFADRIFFDVGVNEFLWLIDNAKYVVTSSFHGFALSVIFNKKVAAVINPLLPSRLSNLISVLGIPRAPIEALPSVEFDYDAINKKIIYERERSIKYLKGLIDDEYI